MTTELDFWKAMRNEQDSADPVFVYADWLEEKGNAERADLVRTQAQLMMPVSHADYSLLRARERRLLRKRRAQILGPVRSITKRVAFSGGLITPEMTGELFRKNASSIVNESPTLGVRLNNLTNDRLSNCQELSELRAIDLAGIRPDKNWFKLLKSKHLRGVHNLEIHDVARTREFARAFQSGQWPHLRRLSLTTGTEFDLEKLIRSSPTASLRHLRCAFDNENTGAMSALFEAETAPGLQTLKLFYPMGLKHGFADFCGQVNLPSLRRLDMSEIRLNGDEVQRLLENPNLPQLRELRFMVFSEINEDIFSNAELPQLQRLTMTQDGFGKGVYLAFAESPVFQNLQHLEAESPYEDSLVELEQAGISSSTLESLAIPRRQSAKNIKAIPTVFPNLESLSLACDNAGLKSLCHLEIPHLKRLEITWPEMDAQLCRQLIKAPWFTSLKTLAFEYPKLEEGALVPLTQSPVAENLRDLTLGRVGDEDAQALAESEFLIQVDRLACDVRAPASLKKIKSRYRDAFDPGGRGLFHDPPPNPVCGWE